MRSKHEIALINRHYREINPLDFGEQECAPGHTYGPAIRRYTLIHFVISGKGCFTNGSGMHPLHAGEAFIIRPGEVTVYAADESEPWHYLWIGFNGALSHRFAELPCVITPPAGVHKKLREVFSYNGTAEEYLAGRLFELYAYLFNGTKSKEDYILKIQNYVETNYNTQCDVADIAAVVGLERHYLARLFKQKTGGTLKEYITEKRMEEAAQLLEAGNTVGYTAQMIGYSDPFVFSKTFKKRFGMPPGEWKTKERNDE